MALLIVFASCMIGFGFICAAPVSENDTILIQSIAQIFICMQPCSYCGEWSRCVPIAGGPIGLQTRTKPACVRDPVCGFLPDTEEETESQLCIPFCPSEYMWTEHGYCLKLYTTLLNYDNADAHCKGDGGYLVNINSDEILEDIKNNFPENEDVLIDGKRPGPGEPFEYTNGEAPIDMNWGPDQPGDANIELCVVYGRNYYRNDGICNKGRYFMCQILPGELEFS